MDRFEYYKECYYKEIESGNELFNSLSLPVGIVTLLGTVLSYYLTNFDYGYSSTNTIFFLLLSSVATVLLVMAITYLWRAYHITGFNTDAAYLLLPPLNEQEEFFNGLLQYYEAEEFRPTPSADLANGDFERYMIDQYVVNTTNNNSLNSTGRHFVFNCKRFLLLCMAVVIITLVPFAFNYINKSEKPTLIEIKKNVNSAELSKPLSTMATPQKKSPSDAKPDSNTTSSTPKPNSAGTNYPPKPQSQRVKNGKNQDSVAKKVGKKD